MNILTVASRPRCVLFHQVMHTLYWQILDSMVTFEHIVSSYHHFLARGIWFYQMLKRIGPPPTTYICCKLHICTFMRISSYTNIGSFCEIDTLVCSASSLERARSAYMTHIFSSLLEKTSENSKPCRGRVRRSLRSLSIRRAPNTTRSVEPGGVTPFW